MKIDDVTVGEDYAYQGGHTLWRRVRVLEIRRVPQSRSYGVRSIYKRKVVLQAIDPDTGNVIEAEPKVSEAKYLTRPWAEAEASYRAARQRGRAQEAALAELAETLKAAGIPAQVRTSFNGKVAVVLDPTAAEDLARTVRE